MQQRVMVRSCEVEFRNRNHHIILTENPPTRSTNLYQNGSEYRQWDADEFETQVIFLLEDQMLTDCHEDQYCLVHHDHLTYVTIGKGAVEREVGKCSETTDERDIPMVLHEHRGDALPGIGHEDVVEDDGG